HGVGDEGLKVQRPAHVVIAGCAAALAGAEWLHGSGAGWAWAAGGAGVATAGVFLARRPRGLAPGLAALTCLLSGVVLVAGLLEVRRIECCWPEVRAGWMPRDSAELKTTLGAAVVEARRLAEAPSVPDRDGAVSALFEREHGVALRFYDRRVAPGGGDVFDYDTLFSVQPLPASQGEARLAALHATAWRAAVVLAAALLFLFIAAPPGRGRWVVVLVGAWSLTRAPLGPSLRLGSLFSPATFYRPLLSELSASAGSLTVVGV